MAPAEDEPPTCPDDDRGPDDSGGWDDESVEFADSLLQPETGEFDPESFTGLTSDGKYEVGGQIGNGGFSWVFRARQVSTGQDVAVKLPRRPGEACERLRRGGRLLGKIAHPNIAKLIDAGETTVADEKLPYVVMELVQGARSLSTFCREQQLDLPARLELLVDICNAVAAAHQKHVVHRDLKPGNILVSGSGHPCVIDFDIADISKADLSTLTAMGSTSGGVIGTPLYMSPEQIEGRPIGPASDVFSMGVIIRELVTDRPPRVSAAVQVLSCLQSSVFASCATLPTGIARITRGCLNGDPARRYKDAAELAAAIRECLTASSWKDPWWRSGMQAVRQASSDATQAFRDASRQAVGWLASTTAQRLAIAGLVAVALGTAAWQPVNNWRARQQQAKAYSASLAAAARAFDAKVPAQELRQLVRVAEADWHGWRGPDRPLPLELVCLRNLLPGNQPVTLPGVSAATIAPVGEWLATAAAGRVKLSSAAQPLVPLRRLPGLPGQRLSLTIGPGDLLAAGGDAGEWAVWRLNAIDRDSAALLRGAFPVAGPQRFSFAPDGRRLAVVTACGETEVWRLPATAAQSPERISIIRIGEASLSPTTEPPSACLSGDGRRLFVGGATGELLAFDVATGAAMPPVAGPAAGPLTLCRSADGRHLVSFAAGGTLRWHDPATGRPLANGSPAPTNCLLAAFADQENRLLVVRQSAAQGSGGTTLVIFETVSAAGSGPTVSLPVGKTIAALAAGADGRLLVRVADSWQVWSATPGKPAADMTIAAAVPQIAPAGSPGPSAD